MCSAACAKCFLICFNAVFWLAGAGCLGIGIWMKVDPTILHYLHVVNISSTDPLIDVAAWIFIGVGAFMFIVAVIGCCGALRSSQSLLFLYAFLLVIVMILEVVAGVLALVYRKQVMEKLREAMEDQIQTEYIPGRVTAQAWDFLQDELQCCGANNYTDYQGSTWWNNPAWRTDNATGEMRNVPDSCCNADREDIKWKACQTAAEGKGTSDALYGDGCYPAVKLWFSNNSLIIMCIGFAVGAMQILGVIAACSARSAIKKKETIA